MDLLAELARLVVPVACAGCGLLDVRLCHPCAKWLRGSVKRVEHQVPRLNRLLGTPPLPVWALADYAGAVGAQVAAWKDGGREDLTEAFADALVAAFRPVATTQALAIAAVIPMPSTAQSQRLRGRAHLDPIARAVAKSLNTHTSPPLALPANANSAACRAVWLLRKPGRGGQVGNSASGRGGARITVRRQAMRRLPTGARVLLLDDVVTTGATLAAAADALTQAGYHPVGALVLAATPAPRSVATANSAVLH